MITPRRVVIALVLVACGFGLVVAVNHTDTGEPDIIESGNIAIVEQQFPQPGDEVLRQTQIGIDLTSGWTASLVVNGLPIPDSDPGLSRVPALNQVLFTPAAGASITQLPAGQNCVEAIIWRESQSPADARPPLRWCFEVT